LQSNLPLLDVVKSLIWLSVEVSKKKKDLIKHQKGGNIVKGENGLNTDSDVVQRMIPIWGTYKEAEALYNYPSWEQAGWTALSALGDLSMLIPLAGPEIKAGLTSARAANAIGKAAKVSKVKRAVPIIKDANKARKVAHAKTMEDITYPAIYSILGRPSGVGLSLPFRLDSSNDNLTEDYNKTEEPPYWYSITTPQENK
jgi:hypothetical protein